ncbi:uncharacterized protein [Nicotiana sylvestris]|uniref:Uncharacterized protein LOC104222760 n=1 Tax=Nicotiana sylvestris TaxID=4096 RepID=A0A1U7W153_NICSY|nr:PREDICTED: uncharacterized protein LOC104222760 [Nicotiana sylvestris]XP_016471208.1 PREDICTED: uncharacterized protein LOC107793382 [Nicotiana tabacum]
MGYGEYKKYLWWAACSTYEEDFQDQLKSMSQVEDDGKTTVEDLLKYPPTCWSRAFFDTTCKNQSVDNNLTESFNAWILQARHKLIIKMLEEIRIKVMNMLNGNEAELIGWGSEYSPKTLNLYNQFMRIAQKCHVNGSADQGYEVTEGSDRNIVNLGTKKCTCRTWNLCGILCPHAICALLYKKVNPLSEIHWFLSKKAYLQTYSHKLQPVRGEKFWKIEPSQNMDPPEFVRQAGRSKVKRIREANESTNRQGQWSQSRKGRVMTCNNCGEAGHNVRGCAKHSKGKQPMGGNSRRKQNKKQRTLVDEPDAEQPTSPAVADIPTEDDFHLLAP